LALAISSSELWAQGPPVIELGDGPMLHDVSLVFMDVPPLPSEIKVHDIITIEVDEKAEAILNSRFNRQRNGQFTAQLKQFLRIVEGPDLDPTSTNSPQISGTLQNRLQALGTETDQDGITFKIAATVVDVLPNGTLIVEARKTIHTGQDFIAYRLTGKVDKLALKPNRTVRTESIADLSIERLPKGKIFNSTKVNWGTRILDIIFPF
jgi:flagellar L-ring protein precursor FlgH